MANRKYHQSMQADIEGTMEIVRIAAGFDWTWSVDDLAGFSAATGWRVVETDERGDTLATNLAVNRPEAEAYFEDGLKEIGVFVTDIVDPDEDIPLGLITDLFVDFSDGMVAQLGQPSRRAPGIMSEIRWDLRNVVVSLLAYEKNIKLRLIDPSYVAWWDSVENGDFDEVY